MHLNPIHAVQDWCKVRRLVRAVRRGDDVAPILYEGLPNNGTLLAGTHRMMANDILEMLGDRRRIAMVELSNVLDDPECYDLTNDDADALREAAADGEYDAIDRIWDRRHDA